jgi:hypothetical protein
MSGEPDEELRRVALRVADYIAGTSTDWRCGLCGVYLPHRPDCPVEALRSVLGLPPASGVADGT